MQNNKYSQELQDLTKEMLSTMKISMMKHIDGSFGIYLNSSNMSIVVLDTFKKYHFNSLDELLLKGWCVD